MNIAHLRELLEKAKTDGVLHMRNRELRFDPADGSFSQFDESGHMETVAYASTAACPTCIPCIDVAIADADLICAAVNALPALLEIAEAAEKWKARFATENTADFDDADLALFAAVDLLVSEWARIWLARNARERSEGADLSLATEEAIAMVCKHVLAQDAELQKLRAGLAEALEIADDESAGDWTMGSVNGIPNADRIAELRKLVTL